MGPKSRLNRVPASQMAQELQNGKLCKKVKEHVIMEGTTMKQT